MLDHKTGLHKCRKIKITPGIFSEHSGMKLEINSQRKTGKFTNMWKLNTTLFNSHWVKEEIKKEIRKYLETNKNKNTIYQNLWDVAKAVPREKLIAINVYI